MTPEIYLDTNATTPVLPAALRAAEQVLGAGFGNPSSSHSTGLVAKRLMDAVRQQAADLIGAGDGRVLFVSGATEGIQTAVLSALCDVRARQARGDKTGRWLVYGATEHKAVAESLAHWNLVLGLGLELCALPVDAQGHHDLAWLADKAADTAVLCTMAANNETGVVSDLAGIERVLVAQASPALWLADCVQALGKLPLALSATRIDYAPFSGHKLYAPKGIGLLYVREGSPFTPLMVGGGQEGGARAGTENMAGIAALGAVLAALHDGHTFTPMARLQDFRAQLAQSLCEAFEGVVFNASFEHALPTTLNFSVPGVSSKVLLDLFDAAGVRVSAGSACSAQRAEPSYVLEAMGLPEWRTTSAVRLSFGPLADAAFIERACAAIAVCGQALKDSQAQAAQAAVSSKDNGSSTPEDEAAPVALSAQALQGIDLAWDSLASFMAAHPGAQLVDVRESFEHLASAALKGADAPAVNVPLAQLPQFVPAWLAQPEQPVVFFCRSGNRSLDAALRLRARGHTQVRHLGGGLAGRGA
jgi:cysteine desulfurase